MSWLDSIKEFFLGYDDEEDSIEDDGSYWEDEEERKKRDKQEAERRLRQKQKQEMRRREEEEYLSQLHRELEDSGSSQETPKSGADGLIQRKRRGQAAELVEQMSTRAPVQEAKAESEEMREQATATEADPITEPIVQTTTKSMQARTARPVIEREAVVEEDQNEEILVTDHEMLPEESAIMEEETSQANEKPKKILDDASMQAISDELYRRYPNENEPVQYIAKSSAISEDHELYDEIVLVDGGEYWHFVSLGLSRKANTSSVTEKRFYELSLKLKKYPALDEEECVHIADTMQSLLRYLSDSGAPIGAYQYLNLSEDKGIDAGGYSEITGFLVLPSDLGPIQTDKKRIEFLELVGMTQSELRAIREEETTVERLSKKLEAPITDYGRKSLI